MTHPTAQDVARRLAALRERMAAAGVDLLLVPSNDEHQNEYLAPHKRRREALSGFTGSAGDLAVARDEAHLWVDSRYFLQADREVDPALVQVHKLGTEGEVDLPAWLAGYAALHHGLRVGFDPFLLPLRLHEELSDKLAPAGAALVPTPENLADAVWADRPAAPGRPVYALPESLTGESVADKLARVRAAMSRQGAAALVLTRLDDVAWLTNLRGADVPHNPVFEAYAVVTRDQALCFTDNPVPSEARAAVADQVEFRPYGAFRDHLAALAREPGRGEAAVWADRDGTAQGVALALAGTPLVTAAPNPVVKLKAIKNPVEIAASREAHLRAGRAKVRSFARLFALLAAGETVSEARYADLLQEDYAAEEGYSDLSFTTIAAFGANGAIVHYATPDPDLPLTPGGLLLVDSGVQLAGATTDDTRTVAIGEPTERHRLRYTDVLRGHIRLAMQVFPHGTTGQALDALARSPLWNAGLDFGHGTGHGVGAFLNVHEGPQNISPRGTVPLEPGMIVSNEPGFYQAGWGGIRLENLYLVEEALGLPPHPAGKPWLRLSPLTLIPFDPTLIAWPRLTSEEHAWLADYHKLVWERLAPGLDAASRAWLEVACRLPA